MANKFSGAKMATRGEIGKEIRLARKALGYTQKNFQKKPTSIKQQFQR